MNYFTTTYKSSEIPNDVILDINNLLSNVVKLKKDSLWENYQEYNFDDNLYTSVQYNENGRLELLSGIHTRNFYPNNTYRVFNRLVRNPQGRLGGAKTNNGEQPSHVMLSQQIEIVEELQADFYFISRQHENNRWMNFYIKQFNRDYCKDLTVTKKRYWITDSKDPAKGAQLLIHPLSKSIPFVLYV